MGLRLTFEIDMQADYHVGAGYGLGTEIDSALLRDADGVPVLRGTIVTGLLRDAVWRLLQLAPLAEQRVCQASGATEAPEAYCGQYNLDHDPLLCPICRVFGTPLSMKRWRFSSARPKDLDEESGPWSQHVTRVRVNPRTRRAAPQQLFSEEEGASGAFRFAAECLSEDVASLDEAALLVAAARFVRQLGRSRRRGQGACLLSLVGVEGSDLGPDPQEALLERFSERWLEGKVAKPVADMGKRMAPLDVPASSEEHTQRFELWVRLDEPLVVADRAAAGNRFETQSLISGKTLRGALAHRVAQAYDLEDADTYQAFLDLFVNGAVRFPMLYPLLDHNYPAIPVPRDGMRCKVYPHHPIQWGAQGKQEFCSKCGNPVKALRSGFYGIRKFAPERFSPGRRSEMHIRIDPETGRVAEGQLYDYVALEAGQYFIGELTCADEETWELLQTMMGLDEEHVSTLHLGRARQRGYGEVSVGIRRRPQASPPVWIQRPLEDRVKEEMEQLVLTLLTDAIIVDPWGRYATGFDSVWLSRELGVDVEVLPERAYAGSHTVDGFNTQWRLPTWRAEALEAGSSVRLRLLQPVTEQVRARLSELERSGIGERRHLGYGQVAFEHPIYQPADSLPEAYMPIPEELEIVIPPQGDGASAQVDSLSQQLEGVLQKRGGAWTGMPFTALARWLAINRYRDVDSLLRDIRALGSADGALRDRIRAQGRRPGIDEYGAREAVNHLEDKQALHEIAELLESVRDDLPERLWPEAIAMLADRLAETAEGK